MRGRSPIAPTDAATLAATKARMEAYQKVQEFDWSSGADWKTTANILFTVPPQAQVVRINLLARLWMIYPLSSIAQGCGQLEKTLL